MVRGGTVLKRVSPTTDLLLRSTLANVNVNRSREIRRVGQLHRGGHYHYPRRRNSYGAVGDEDVLDLAAEIQPYGRSSS